MLGKREKRHVGGWVKNEAVVAQAGLLQRIGCLGAYDYMQPTQYNSYHSVQLIVLRLYSSYWLLSQA